MLEQIVETAQVKSGVAVLDIGTGTGNLASKFLAKECKVSACDYSPEMLLQAHEKPGDINLFQLDLSGDLHELTEYYDRIVASYVLHEFDLDTKLEILEMLCRHLTPRGFIVLGDIAFPDKSVHDEARQIFSKVWDDDEYYWLADEMQAACEIAGLEFGYEQVSHCAAVMTERLRK